MTIFVTFALSAIVLYLVAVLMRPAGAVTGMGAQLSRAVQDVIGQIIPDPVVRWLASLIVSLLIMLVPITFFFHQNFRNPLGPDITYGEFLTSVAVSKAVFGVLFGLIFAYWFRSLLLTDASKGFTYKEIIVSIVMVILLLLGVGGQTLLANLLDRLTGFEVGNTKLAFAEGHSQTVTASVNLAFRNDRSAGAPDTSQGLDFLAAIDKFVEKDAASVAVVTHEHKPWGDTMDFARTVAAKPARCLQSYVEQTADSSRVAAILNESAALIGSAIGLADASALEKSISQTAEQIDEFLGRLNGVEPCEALSAVGPAVTERLKPSADGDRWRERPYLWLAAASMFAYGHHYPPAIALLDQWTQALEAHRSIEPVRLPGSEADRTIFEIRVRTAMSVFIEEWIRYSPSSKTVAVLNYHLSNLQKLLDALNSIAIVGQDLQKVRDPKNSLKQAAFAAAPEDRGPCPVVSPRAGDERATLSDDDYAHVRLLETFISTKVMWITTALDHPEYVRQFAAQAHNFIDDLLSMNLSCSRLSLGPEPGDRSDKPPAMDRAEMLHLVALIALNESRDAQARQTGDPDRAKTALKQAKQAVDLGLQIVEPFKQEALRGVSGGLFLNRIAGDQAVSDYDDLVDDQANLDSAIAR